MTEIAQNHQQIQERIANAAQRAGRDPTDITLVAVTKTWPVETVRAAYEAGMRHFGENRAEELAEKVTALADLPNIVWHYIGNLQSRKTSFIADNADVFHALDRMKIANRLSKQRGDNGRRLPVFLEVNISGERSKAGFLMSNWEEDATQRENLRKVVTAVAQLPGLQHQGLMTMAPWNIPDEDIRTIFRRTRQLSEWLQGEFPNLTLNQLSMGMTDDFEIAIEEGATHVRVGRAIFGERH